MTKDEARTVAVEKAIKDTPRQISMMMFTMGVAGRAFNAGYDFAKSESNDRAVIDGFLARVDERMQAIVFQGKNRPLADAYLEAKRQVYAEMFGGEGEEKNG